LKEWFNFVFLDAIQVQFRRRAYCEPLLYEPGDYAEYQSALSRAWGSKHK
jgi:hypothetical protein